jgi:uncharacterized protein with PIN domain
MIANCPNCGHLVEAVEFTAKQQREEHYQGTNRKRLFDCPKCGKGWYGSRLFPRGNILEKEAVE